MSKGTERLCRLQPFTVQTLVQHLSPAQDIECSTRRKCEGPKAQHLLKIRDRPVHHFVKDGQGIEKRKVGLSFHHPEKDLTGAITAV